MERILATRELRRRGWTKTLMRRFLSHHPSGNYLLSEVIAAEGTREFLLAKARINIAWATQAVTTLSKLERDL